MHHREDGCDDEMGIAAEEALDILGVLARTGDSIVVTGALHYYLDTAHQKYRDLNHQQRPNIYFTSLPLLITSFL
jgi:hypothetical protein